MKILRVYCNLVDGSMASFYTQGYDLEPAPDQEWLDGFVPFLKWIFQHGPGRIDIDTTGKQLTIELLDTDDFGPPPLALNIKVENDGKFYEIRIPYKNESFIYFDEVKEERFG